MSPKSNVFAGRKVLVIDDHPDTLTLSEMILKNEGHEVYGAECGEQGVALAEEHLPEVIYSDLMLPDMDGFELAGRLRRQEHFARSVLFALSGLSDAESIEKAADVGFDYYTVKPMDPELFVKSVHAPRQDGLILLSGQLLERSARLQDRARTLTEKCRIIQARSQEMQRRFHGRHFRF